VIIIRVIYKGDNGEIDALESRFKMMTLRTDTDEKISNIFV